MLTINDKWFIIMAETKKGQPKGWKVKRMKTAELLNKAVELGFDREKALTDIDASFTPTLAGRTKGYEF